MVPKGHKQYCTFPTALFQISGPESFSDPGTYYSVVASLENQARRRIRTDKGTGVYESFGAPEFIISRNFICRIERNKTFYLNPGVQCIGVHAACQPQARSQRQVSACGMARKKYGFYIGIVFSAVFGQVNRELADMPYHVVDRKIPVPAGFHLLGVIIRVELCKAVLDIKHHIALTGKVFVHLGEICFTLVAGHPSSAVEPYKDRISSGKRPGVSLWGIHVKIEFYPLVRPLSPLIKKYIPLNMIRSGPRSIKILRYGEPGLSEMFIFKNPVG